MKRKKVIALLLTSALLTSSAITGTYAQSQPALLQGNLLTDKAPAGGSEASQPPSIPSGEAIGAPGTTSGGAMEGPGSTSGSAIGGPGGQPGGQPGSSSTSITYKGATEITSADEQTGKTYASTTADESALLVNTKDSVTLNNIELLKTGDSDGGDNCNFYGLNAGLLVMGGSTTTIKGGKVTTKAEGANGVFSYGGNGAQNGAAGDGTTVNISDVTIETTGDGSGGIMTTGGGQTNATNLTVTTNGRSSAPIRTDRGGGTVTVTKGTYTSNGLGSPAIYSTADITVSDATLVSNLSEGVCIEGKNSITLKNCDLTANNTKLNGNAQFYDTIMIYQSMSGDADSGTSTFAMTDGKLTSKNGHVFHVTNTNAVINLQNVTITNDDTKNVLLSVANDGWSGAENKATLNATKQTLSGDIIVSNEESSRSTSKSELTLNLKDHSTYTGAIWDGSRNISVGTVTVNLADSTSIWVLSGDSYVTDISGAGKVNYNGHTLYVNGVAYTESSPYTGVGQTTETQTDTGTDTTDTGSDTKTTETKTTLKTVKFKNTSKTLKLSKVKKSNISYSILKTAKVGKVTYTVTKGNKKNFKVSKTGILTVKKGTAKGTYKIKIKVAKNKTYASATQTVTIKIKK